MYFSATSVIFIMTEVFCMRISKINRKSVFYSLSAIAISNTVLQLLGFVYRIFLSRMTGAEGLGVYQLIMPFYSVISSLTLTGLTVAVSRISAARAGVSDYIGAGRCVTLARRIFIVFVVVISTVVLMNAVFISHNLLGDIRILLSLPFILICLFLTGLENILKNYFYGVGKVAPQIASELSEQVIRALVVAALLLTFRPRDAGISAMLIIIGMVVSELSSSGLLTLFYLPEKRRRSSHRSAPVRVREILSIALPVSGAATVNNLLSSLNSILIPRRLRVSGMATKAATETFGVMFGMTMPLLSFPIAFIASLTSVMVPKLSEDAAVGNLSAMRRRAGKTIHSTSLLAMPCIALLIPLGSPLCRLLFSHSDAGAFMLPLCIATLFSYYELTTVALLNGIGEQKRAAIYIIIGGLVQIALTWCVGFPEIGMSGFVAGYIASGAITALLNFCRIIRKLRLRPRYSNWFLTPLLASTLAALLCDISFDLFLSLAFSLPISILLAGIIGIITYSVALSALGTSIVRYLGTITSNS